MLKKLLLFYIIVSLIDEKKVSMLNFKRFFENLLFSESPSFMHMLLEGRHDIITRPVNIDKNDIRFLEQFPPTHWAQALYQRFNMLHQALKEFYATEVSSNYEGLAKRIEAAIQNPSLINGLIGILPPEQASDLRDLATRRRYALSHQIPEMNDKEIQIEAEKIAHESLISQKRDDFVNRLKNMKPQHFRVNGGYFNQQKQKRQGGAKTQEIIEAYPMLDALYEKLDKEYGFDLAFPEGSPEQSTAITEGLKFPSLDQLEQVVKNYLNANYHRVFGELDDKDAVWYQHDLQDNRIADEYLKELKDHFVKTLKGRDDDQAKSNPKYERMSSAELNKAAEEEAEREFYRLAQSGQLKSAPDPSRHPAGAPLQYKKLGIVVNQTDKGVEITSASFKNLLAVGDIIKSIAKNPINNIEDYKRAMDSLNFGDKQVPIEVERDGAIKKIEIKEVREIYMPPKISLPFKSSLAKFITPIKHTLNGISDIEETPEGLKLIKVKSSFKKYRDKYIQTIDGTEVHTLDDLNEKLKTLKQDQTVTVTFKDASEMQTSIVGEKSSVADAHGYESVPTHIMVPKVNPSHYLRKIHDDEEEDDTINKLGFRKKHVRVGSHVHGTETEAPGSIHLNREYSQRIHKTRGDARYEEAYEKIIGSMEKCDVEIKETRNQKAYLHITPNPDGEFYTDIMKGISKCILSAACGGRIQQQAEYAVENYFILHRDILDLLKARLGDSREEVNKLSTSNGRQSFAFTQMSNLMGKGLGNVGTRRLRSRGVASDEFSGERGEKGYASKSYGPGAPVSKSLEDLRKMARDLKQGEKIEAPASLSKIDSGEEIKDRLQKINDKSDFSADVKLSIADKLREEFPDDPDNDAVANKMFIGLNYDQPEMQEVVERWQYMVDNWDKIRLWLNAINKNLKDEKADVEMYEAPEGEKFGKIVQSLKSSYKLPLYVCHAIQNYINSYLPR